MNLDAVENLSQEDIQKLFDDIVENNEFMAICECYFWNASNNPCFARYGYNNRHCEFGWYETGSSNIHAIGGCEMQITSKQACIDYCSSLGGAFTHAYHWGEDCYCRGTQDTRTWSTCDD